MWPTPADEPTPQPASVVRLVRGPRAMLRNVGLIERLTMAWLTGNVVMLGFMLADKLHLTTGGALAIVAIDTVMVFVRLLIVIEYVEFDDEGLHWRSLFRSEHVSWSSLEWMEVDYFAANSFRMCLSLFFVNDATRKLRASVGCDRDSLVEFAAAARERSPFEWRVAAKSKAAKQPSA